MNRRALSIAVLLLLPTIVQAQEAEWPLLLAENFEKGDERWSPFDKNIWRIEPSPDGDGHVYSQHSNETDYNPPHRSPFLISLLSEPTVGAFDLRVKVKSTHEDYDHRDACIVFGYQDPAHFYYVHFGKRTDDHANQIFVVDDAPRTKISTKTTAGTDWDDEWHSVRIVRRSDTGTIQIYFDDMYNPVMEASDKRFGAGQIGLGSFDDTTQWDDLKLHGVKTDKAGN